MTGIRGGFAALSIVFAATPLNAQQAPERFSACPVGAACEDAVTMRRAASSTWIGAGAGFVVGGVATYVILNTGGSTAPCDQDANQDAMSTGECIGITALGALAGAGIGLLIGRAFRSDRLEAISRDGLRIGWSPATRTGIVRIAVPAPR